MGQLLVSIPVFLILSILQTVAISRISIVAGTGDVVMLALIAWIVIDEEGNYLGWAIISGFLISILSAMPMAAVFGIYIVAALLARTARRIFWQSPILALFASVLTASIIKFFIEIFTLQYLGVPAPFIISLASVLLPSLVLNIFYSLPVYVLMGDIAHWIAPKDEIYA